MAAASLRTLVRRRVRELRIARGLTQEALCERAGISLDAVTRIERGQRVPTLVTLERLAHGLGVSVVELVDSGAPAPRRTSVAADRIHAAVQGETPAVQLAIEQALKAILRLAGAIERPHGRRGRKRGAP